MLGVHSGAPWRLVEGSPGATPFSEDTDGRGKAVFGCLGLEADSRPTEKMETKEHGMLKPAILFD